MHMQALLKDERFHQPRRTQDWLTFEFLSNICECYINTWEYLSITSNHYCNCQFSSNCVFTIMVSLQKIMSLFRIKGPCQVLRNVS